MSHCRLLQASVVVTFIAAAGLLGACRAPGEPAGEWPPDPPPAVQSPHTGASVVPGQPEGRTPTAPPEPEPGPGPEPPGPQEPDREPAPFTPSPAAPGVPRPGEPGAERPEPGMRELFPHVRADIARRVVEFDGIVPIDAHETHAPRVYLEVTVCTPDSKEHESLVMTQARPSHVHAALLAIGLEPGKPGALHWNEEQMTTTPPAGDPVLVTFLFKDGEGKQQEIPATRWIVNADNGEPFAKEGEGGFVFAGSVMRTRQGREVYDADGVGTLVGLTTFGAETIAWRQVISPDSQVHTPEWIADAKTIPAYGTPVTVRVRPGGGS
jgi:hypothetical protein